MRYKPPKNQKTKFSKRQMPHFELPRLGSRKREGAEAEKSKTPKVKAAKSSAPKAKSFSQSKTHFHLPQLDKKWVIVLAAVLAVLLLVGGIIAAVSLTAAHNNEVTGIAVTAAPEKTVYFVGQEADYTGLEITATRRSGETFVVPLAECEIIGFTSEYAVQEKVLLVKYAGCQALFSVEIRERPKPTPVLRSITLLEAPKLTRATDGNLRISGGSIRVDYTNADPKIIGLVVDMIDLAPAEDGGDRYVLTITYTDRELNQSATITQTITVTE